MLILKRWSEGLGPAGILSGTEAGGCHPLLSLRLPKLAGTIFSSFIFSFLCSGCHLYASASGHHLPPNPSALLKPAGTISLISYFISHFPFSSFSLCLLLSFFSSFFLFFLWVPSLHFPFALLQSVGALFMLSPGHTPECCISQRGASTHIWHPSYYIWCPDFCSCGQGTPLHCPALVGSGAYAHTSHRTVTNGERVLKQLPPPPTPGPSKRQHTQGLLLPYHHSFSLRGRLLIKSTS